jgi:hypothetical protein
MIIYLVFFPNCLAQDKIDDPNDLGLSENIMALSNKPTSQFGQPVLGTSDLYSVGKKTPISSLHLSEKCSFTKSKLRFF